MKECCEKWLWSDNCQPKQPQKGKFVEIQTCPECGEEMAIIFRYDGLLNSGLPYYSVLGVE